MPNKFWLVWITVMGLFLLGNFLIQRLTVSARIVDVPMINKTMLLNYQERAKVICQANGFPDGWIEINTEKADVYLYCQGRPENDGRLLSQRWPLEYTEVIGEFSKIVR